MYVRDNCKLCMGIGAQQAVTGKMVRGTQSMTDSQIRGYTWQMPELQNLNIVQGRGFTETDEEHASHVAIIGTDIQDNLFAGIDPLGQELRVDGQPYTVIGVSEKQGSTFGQSQDNWVGVPLTAYQKSYGTSKTLTIYVKAGSAGPALEAAADEVRVLMRSQRHDAPGAPDSFELDTNNTLVGFFGDDYEIVWGGGGGDCADLAGGGRHCDYEHHAGERDGADAGDRDTEGAGGAAAGHPDAVSDRVGHDGAGGRSVRRAGRDCGGAGW